MAEIDFRHIQKCRMEPMNSEPLSEVTDITYIPYFPYGNKLLYLSSIKDLFNGEIIVHTIADHQDVSLVLDTLHSDQGFVYTSYVYQQAIMKKALP